MAKFLCEWMRGAYICDEPSLCLNMIHGLCKMGALEVERTQSLLIGVHSTMWLTMCKEPRLRVQAFRITWVKLLLVTREENNLMLLFVAFFSKFLGDGSGWEGHLYAIIPSCSIWMYVFFGYFFKGTNEFRWICRTCWIWRVLEDTKCKQNP